MPDCPRCRQPVDAQAITCPYCRVALKAHGHPGIPLYRAKAQEPLCLTCTYHADDTCNYPKRPDAMDCTMYQDLSQPVMSLASQKYTSGFLLKTWLKRNLVWFVLLGLVLVSLILALLQ